MLAQIVITAALLLMRLAAPLPKALTTLPASATPEMPWGNTRSSRRRMKARLLPEGDEDSSSSATAPGLGPLMAPGGGGGGGGDDGGSGGSGREERGCDGRVPPRRRSHERRDAIGPRVTRVRACARKSHGGGRSAVE